MLLDRAFRSALRNYSTLFLAVAIVTVTLHLVYAFVFREVIAVSELHFEISNLRPSVKLQGAGSTDVSRSETIYWILTAIELALVPIFVAVTNRVIQKDESGDVPTVTDGYTRMRSARGRMSLRWGGSGWITVLAAAVLALAIGFLFERSGLLLTDFPSDRWLFLGTGLVRGLSRAVAAPFFLCAVVIAGRAARERAPRP